MEREEVRELTGKILSSRALDSDARNLALNTCAALEGFSSTEEYRVSGLVNFLEQIKMANQSISDTVAELISREEKLFVKLLERVGPCLDPIAVKVPMRASGEFPEEIEAKDFLEDDKGVLIWDNFSVEEEDSPSYGSYAGEQIWLLTSGKLVQLTRTGTWEPGNCEWTAEARAISTEGAIALRKAADDGAREGYLHPEVAEVMRTLSYIAQYVLPTLARRAAGESGESAASSPAGDGSASEPTGGAGIQGAGE